MARAGQSLEDFCRVCKEPRDHRVVAVDGAGEILRVICGYCGSQHNYRGNRVPGERRPTGTTSAPGVVRRGHAEEGDELSLVSDRERAAPPLDLSTFLDGDFQGDPMDLELLLRRIIREEAGLTPVAPAKKWRGGKVVITPGDPSLQGKEIPIETLFNKVVMIRNRLRVLEQQINATESLPDDQKLKLQGYVTGAYGSLTTFNVLFADEDDKFKGSGGD